MKAFFLIVLLLMLPLPAVSKQLTLFSRSSAEAVQVELNPAELQWRDSKQRLVFGILKDDHPPFAMNASGKDFEGITADYLGLISAVLQLPVEIRRYADKAGLLDAVRLGEIDFYGYARMTELDVPDISSTVPYADDIPVLVTAKPHQNTLIQTLLEQPFRLAFSKHYLSNDRLHQYFPKAVLQPYGDATQAIEAVALGHADVFLGNVISAHYLIHAGHFSGLQINNFTPLPSGHFHFYAAAHDNQLLVLLNKVLGAIPVTEQQQILQRWSAGRAIYMLAQQIELSEAEHRYLAQATPVRIGHIPGDTPLEQGVGIMKSLIEAISSKTGLQFEWVEAPTLSELLQMLQQGKADMSAILAPTAERSAYLKFTRPYLVTSYALLTKSGPKYQQLRLEQMAGKTLAIQYNHATQRYIRDLYPDIRLKEFDSLPQSIAAVLNGEADAVVENLVLARFYSQQRYAGQLQISSSFMPSGARFTLAVSSQLPELHSILDKTLLSIPPDQMALLSDWSVTITPQSFWQSYRSQIQQGIALFVLIVLAFLFWNFYLRRQVRERQLLLEQVEQAKEQAVEASKAKSFFLATMSHEIRTPLHAIIGTLELAKRKAAEQIWDFTAIDIAYDSAQGLKDLVGDILDIAKIEAGQLELKPQPVRLNHEAQRVCAVFIGMAKSKGLYLKYQPDQSLEHYLVQLDPLLFKQLLSNLLNNAIKFTQQGGVELRLELLQQTEMQPSEIRQDESLPIRLCVTDTGVGINPDLCEKVLKPFQQLGSSDQISGVRGSGLGLSICQTIVQLMQGHFHILSEEGKGTEIRIELPLPFAKGGIDEARSPLPEVEPELQNEKPLDLLVVDDHQVNRLLIQRQLSHIGHQVWQAGDGRQALELLKQQQVDLVLTDCDMPVMNGYQLAQAIRADEKLRHLTVIGLTASAQSDEIARCIAAGMNDCLFKPISLKELQHNLQKYACHKTTFNVAQLYKLAGPDPQFAQQMLQAMCQSNSNDIQLLKQLQQQSDWQGLRRLAHKIKGAAVLIQAQQLCDSCEVIEQAADHELTGASLHLLAALKVFNREAQLWCEKRLQNAVLGEEN